VGSGDQSERHTSHDRQFVNRGIAMYNGMVIAPGIDGRLFALDAITGKPVWETRVAYPQQGYYMTMAPRVAGGKVIIGVSGGDSGETRGFFDAYDAATGQRSWRFYTVPGDPSQPYENEAMRAAAKTWGGDFYTKGGGGAVWDGFAYDPDANLVYVGTGNAEPWVQKFRGARNLDNLYTCSILAVDLTTGKLKWHFQTVPNDNWDFDSVRQLMLLDLRIDGRTRKVLTQAPKILCSISWSGTRVAGVASAVERLLRPGTWFSIPSMTGVSWPIAQTRARSCSRSRPDEPAWRRPLHTRSTASNTWRSWAIKPMVCFRRIFCALLFVAFALAQNTLPALRIAGNMTTIELAPVLVAAAGIYPGSVTVINRDTKPDAWRGGRSDKCGNPVVATVNR
jgi:PQQ-dependent dehydrogenase (methanol/ethanol family)